MQDTINITKANAVKAYNSADETGKTLLSDLLGKQHFGSIMDRVKAVEDALIISGKQWPLYKEMDDPRDIAEESLKLIIEVLNEGREGNPLYYPCFNTSGGGFSFLDFNFDDSNSCVGARLRLFTPELAIYVGKQFTDLYRIFMGY